MIEANAKYKEEAYKWRELKLAEGDFVMVLLRKVRFPVVSYSKLKKINFVPCQIIKKINNNADVIDLPEEFTYPRLLTFLI